MRKSDLLKKLDEISDDEEIYVIADSEDSFDLARMKPARYFHSVTVTEKENGEMEELLDIPEYTNSPVKSIFLIY